MTLPPRHWEELATHAPRVARLPLWREHADRVNGAWLRAALAGRERGSVLKTDVFDEVMGAGLVSELAQGRSRFVAIDLSVSLLRAARARWCEWPLAAADVRRLPFRDGSFDVVVSLSTLDHFESPSGLETAVRELHRVLRPGGLLLLTLDNPQNPFVALRNRLPFGLLHAAGLVPYFVGSTCGRSELVSLLARAGFEVQGVDSLLHCPRVIAIACAALLERVRAPRLRRGFLSALAACEAGARWRTRFFSGHFVAAAALRPAGAQAESGSSKR